MLIALVGSIGSGKDTVGRYLVEEHGYHDMAFADALKDTLAAMFCWDRDMLEGKTPASREWRNQIDPWWADRLGIPHFTPRWAMQNVGTQCLRGHFHDALWIMNVEKRIEKLRVQKPLSDIVLTDGRFPNELKMAQDQGGYVVRVRRGPEPVWYEIAKLANSDGKDAANARAIMETTYADVHISEWAWVGYPFDDLIENDGTIDDLFRKAARLRVQAS